ncbi:MAG: FAD-dependent oxidoreductase, partial [Ilumatobacteraceae bacterium]
QPEELDIAIAVHRVQGIANLPVSRIRHKWAGLRNFVADRSPVAGFDDAVEGFFWFAGQGGYGIQISPALAQAGASLVRSGALPANLTARGLDSGALDRRRLDGLSGLEGH